MDPRLVTKKKGNEEQEIQDGWIGHVIPFELVQDMYLKEDTDAIRAMEGELAEIPGEYEEILEEISEDDKESSKECFTEEGDTFVLKEVSKKLKELKKDKSEEGQRVYRLFTSVDELSKKEKKLKDEIKTGKAALELKTMETIENLTDAQVLELLELKWIDPLTKELAKLPDLVVDSLVSKIQVLQKKYATTFLDLENEIRQTEKELAKIMDDLDGDEYDLKGLGEFKSLLLGE